MSTVSGRDAEMLAAKYLVNLGFKILNQNWKNRFCEIDIVASHQDVVHFVEVKYRASSVAGEAIEYITSTKLKRMYKAAQFWLAENQWDGDCVLDAIAINGEIKISNLEFIQNVSN